MKKFNVNGMTCGGCVRAITSAIQRIDPAAEVKVDIALKQVNIDSQLESEILANAIGDAGFEVVSINE